MGAPAPRNGVARAPWRDEIGLLLGRPELVVNGTQADAWLEERDVLVTGAAGSIGSGIARRLAQPHRRLRSLLLLDRSESALYRLEQDAGDAHGPRVVPLLADLAEPDVARRVMERFAPHVVFHAAAYKHVPMLECHPAEAIRNNVGATRALAEAARACGVERFVLVSTDKAIRPSSVMGASKRVAEALLQGLAVEAGSPTRFITVRFGNVLDSTGNVVERFGLQIARGGPVTITHPRMSRYFMTRAEATGLMLHAGMLGDGGDVFLLKIDGPQRVLDLAIRMIELAGLEVGRDIEIAVREPRPGEKIEEDYYGSGLELRPTPSPHILRAELPAVDPSWIRSAVQELLDLAGTRKAEPLIEALARIIPDYHRTSSADAAGGS